MKLYTRHQLFKSALVGIISGAIIALALGFAFIPAQKASRSSKKSSAVQTAASAADTAGSAVLADSTVSGGAALSTNSVNPTLPVANASSGVTYTQDEAQNISVYEACNEAVVNITTQVMAYDWFYQPIGTQEGGSGSGSIIDKRGYVVTNVHVIDNATKISISLADGTSYDGRVIGMDRECDIAVVKFDPPAGVALRTIAFGDSDNLKVGQKVIAIGNPFALERTMTTGIVSGLGRPIQESTSVIIRNMIQTDAAINPGNSGGPLLDSAGRMIGINTMIYSNSGSSSGVGFAIPVSTARRVVSDLLTYGKVNRGVMDLKLVQNTRTIANYAGYEISNGMIISEIGKKSKAAAAGLKAGTQAVQYGSRFNPTTIYLGGDIITNIDSISVTKLADYYSALEDKRPGEKVNVTVYRGGKYKTFTVTLDADAAAGGTSDSAAADPGDATTL